MVAFQEIREGSHRLWREPKNRFDFVVVWTERRVEGKLRQPPREFNVPRRDALPKFSPRLAGNA